MAIKEKSIKQEMKKRLETITSRDTLIGLVPLGFAVVFREGLETVLFPTPLLVQDALGTLVGMSAEITSALLLAYAIFAVGVKINLRRFLRFTSIMLILLAGGLAGNDAYELLEYSPNSGFQAGWPNLHSH
jgi:high-affinity iron transporter